MLYRFPHQFRFLCTVLGVIYHLAPMSPAQACNRDSLEGPLSQLGRRGVEVSQKVWDVLNRPIPALRFLDVPANIEARVAQQVSRTARLAWEKLRESLGVPKEKRVLDTNEIVEYRSYLEKNPDIASDILRYTPPKTFERQFAFVEFLSRKLFGETGALEGLLKQYPDAIIPKKIEKLFSRVRNPLEKPLTPRDIQKLQVEMYELIHGRIEVESSISSNGQLSTRDALIIERHRMKARAEIMIEAMEQMGYLNHSRWSRAMSHVNLANGIVVADFFLNVASIVTLGIPLHFARLEFLHLRRYTPEIRALVKEKGYDHPDVEAFIVSRCRSAATGEIIYGQFRNHYNMLMGPYVWYLIVSDIVQEWEDSKKPQQNLNHNLSLMKELKIDGPEVLLRSHLELNLNNKEFCNQFVRFWVKEEGHTLSEAMKSWIKNHGINLP